MGPIFFSQSHTAKPAIPCPASPTHFLTQGGNPGKKGQDEEEHSTSNLPPTTHECSSRQDVVGTKHNLKSVHEAKTTIHTCRNIQQTHTRVQKAASCNKPRRKSHSCWETDTPKKQLQVSRSRSRNKHTHPKGTAVTQIQKPDRGSSTTGATHPPTGRGGRRGQTIAW